jgi:CheY-like chemotaxis protein
MSAPTILVVDDNATNVRLLKVLLKAHGFAVRTASDAIEALAMLAEQRPQLILMDIQMPGMDGLELTRRIKADPHTQGIPVVALTAYAMKGDEHRMFQAGCDYYVSKPIDVDNLPRQLKEWLPGGEP